MPPTHPTVGSRQRIAQQIKPMSLDITVYSCVVKLVKEDDHPQLFSLYFIQETETNPDPVQAGNKVRVFLSAEQADYLRDQLSMAIEPIIDDTTVFETLPTQRTPCPSTA